METRHSLMLVTDYIEINYHAKYINDMAQQCATLIVWSGELAADERQ